ncbi:MAG TPA: phospholipase D-like domain-containing protein, partial [Candidatus Baltobacteraceae bacterium]|nr:phospholipase D-like domain-containing protein [Candidatus Baltobacteraceae bacterium]
NPVATALENALARGVRVHLVVASREYNSNDREQRYVATLKAHGAIFDTSDNDQKIAVIDNSNGFVGSANATGSLRDQIDFGYITDSQSMLNVMQEAINEDSGHAFTRR